MYMQANNYVIIQGGLFTQRRGPLRFPIQFICLSAGSKGQLSPCLYIYMSGKRAIPCYIGSLGYRVHWHSVKTCGGSIEQSYINRGIVLIMGILGAYCRGKRFPPNSLTPKYLLGELVSRIESSTVYYTPSYHCGLASRYLAVLNLVFA